MTGRPRVRLLAGEAEDFFLQGHHSVLALRYPVFHPTVTAVFSLKYRWQFTSKHRAQELCESRVGRTGRNKPTVSVDVKQHFNNNFETHIHPKYAASNTVNL